MPYLDEKNVESVLDALIDRGCIFSDESFRYHWNDEFN